MRQLTIEVQDSKYKFILEVLHSFDFINVKETKGVSHEKETSLLNIVRGMQEAILVQKGKVKSRPAKDFLNEL